MLDKALSGIELFEIALDKALSPRMVTRPLSTLRGCAPPHNGRMTRPYDDDAKAGDSGGGARGTDLRRDALLLHASGDQGPDHRNRGQADGHQGAGDW